MELMNRPDDIRPHWDMGVDWNDQRTRIRTTDEPGLLLIYMVSDGNGGCAPGVLISIPEGGPVIHYPGVSG